MKKIVFIMMAGFTILGCKGEVRRRQLSADQLAQKQLSQTYPRSLQGGVYRCNFLDFMYGFGLIQLYYPSLILHFNNDTYSFGGVGDKPAYIFQLGEYSKSEIYGKLKVETPQNVELNLYFNRIDGYGSIKGFSRDIYFENCVRIK